STGGCGRGSEAGGWSGSAGSGTGVVGGADWAAAAGAPSMAHTTERVVTTARWRAVVRRFRVDRGARIRLPSMADCVVTGVTLIPQRAGGARVMRGGGARSCEAAG